MMHVVATAGHVDHGKSTLVRALTGMEPDRLEEERRRGLTIELGYAWTSLPSGRRLAFVDVPGHERFLATMLAGVGPVPAVMFVVAADEGWMPQSEEHLVALEALGVRHCLLVVTRADLADPAPALEQARARLAEAGIFQGRPDDRDVAVSGRTGQGIAALRAALDQLVAGLPPADPQAPVRLWIDRAFSVTGSGTVVTGTLPAGTISVDDELLLDVGTTVRVRALQALKEPCPTVTGVARVAVNLRGHAVPERGGALVTPGRWTYTDLVDVRLTPVGPMRLADGDPGRSLPGRLSAHIGSAAVPCEVRPLGGRAVRLRLARPLPLRLGDILLLRDPGRAPSHGPGHGHDHRQGDEDGRMEVRVLAGARVLDVRPPALRRRGAARERAALLASAVPGAVPGTVPDPVPDAAFALRLHGLLRGGDLLAMGVRPAGLDPVCGDWYADPDRWARLVSRLGQEVRRYAGGHPLEPGMPVDAARHALELPDRALVAALVRPPCVLAGGRIVAGPSRGLPAPVAWAVERLRSELEARPFQAPEVGRLAELGLGAKEVAAAVRAGRLMRVGDGIVLLPGADERAVELLRRLPQPFTVSQARSALGTTRRVAVPLLEHLDRGGLTERLDEVHRRCL